MLAETESWCWTILPLHERSGDYVHRSQSCSFVENERVVLLSNLPLTRSAAYSSCKNLIFATNTTDTKSTFLPSSARFNSFRAVSTYLPHLPTTFNTGWSSRFIPDLESWSFNWVERITFSTLDLMILNFSWISDNSWMSVELIFEAALTGPSGAAPSPEGWVSAHV